MVVNVPIAVVVARYPKCDKRTLLQAIQLMSSEL
jgi:hypothetical protein